MRHVLLLTLVLTASPALAEVPWSRPDPHTTPGVAVAAVGAAEVCQPGYAKSVRHVSSAVKKQVFASYGLRGNHTGYCGGPGGCEVDHLISLELGGSNDPANLWPQSYDSQPWNAHLKDHLENTLHSLVCAGRITLPEAQAAIRRDWIAAYRKYVGEPTSARRNG